MCLLLDNWITTNGTFTQDCGLSVLVSESGVLLITVSFFMSSLAFPVTLLMPTHFARHYGSVKKSSAS